MMNVIIPKVKMLILKNRNPTALVSVVHIADTCNWSFVFAYLSTVFAYFFKEF